VATRIQTEMDPFLVEVVKNYLLTSCHEMAITMMRTSYSPMFNESLDFSCVLFDEHGQMLAQAPYCPAQIGNTVYIVPNAIDELGGEVRPGDVLFTNDPFRGAGHLPEFTVIAPVFGDDEVLLGYAVMIAHMTDIGGMTPGAFGVPQNSYQEGIRIPPMKLCERGELNEGVVRMLLSNVRTPRNSLGDLQAMLAASQVGAERLAVLAQRHGVARLRELCTALKQISERMMRAEIAAWADGAYTAEATIEDDGVEPGRSFRIVVRVVVRGDDLVVDFTGTDPQARGAINQSFGATAAAVFIAVLLSCRPGMPFNAGSFEPVTIIAPPGSIANVEFPGASVGGNSDTLPTTIDLLLRALGQASGTVTAADGGTCGCVAFGGDADARGYPFAHLHMDGIGWGGRADGDGNSVQFVKNGNCPNVPVEVAETRYPLEILEYAIATDSTGHGRHRGGFGSRRRFRVLQDGLRVSSHTNRHRVRPWGLDGGLPGTNTALLFRRGGEWIDAMAGFGTASRGKFANLELAAGDELLFTTPSGGGFGDPLERDPQAVADDVVEGLVSARTARAVYGVVLRDGAVDGGATTELRERLRHERPDDA